MTVYVSDRPWVAEDALWFNLWADTPTEAIACLYGVGGDVSQRRQECNAWEAYRVTPDQFARAIQLGAKVTDRFGPAYWCALRDGNRRVSDAIEKARAR